MTKKSVFGFEEPKDSPGYLLWKTTTAWQRQIKASLSPYGVSHAQFVIMAAVTWFTENDQPANQVNIATLSGLDKMTVSKSLKKLSGMSLIKRTEDKRDTRAKYVSLTVKGLELIAKLVPVVEGVDEAFFGALTITDQRALIKLFNRLV